MPNPVRLKNILPNVLSFHPRPNDATAASKPLLTASREARQKLIGREIAKLLVVFGMDLLDLDQRLALAMTDWGGIPDNWLRRTCARARKDCTFYPKPAEIFAAYVAVKTERYKRQRNLATARDLKMLPPPRMSPIAEAAYWRGIYAMAGMDYDIEEARRKAMKRRTR